METIIRAARAEDADGLGRMHYTAWQEAYADLLPAAFYSDARRDRRVEDWRRILDAPEPGVALRIAVRGDAVVGFATAGPARSNPTAGDPVRDRELWAMYVLAAEYGTGLAARLLEAVLPPGGPAEVWLFEANPRARAFYAKHGFIADGARHLLDAEHGDQPEIRMVR